MWTSKDQFLCMAEILAGQFQLGICTGHYTRTGDNSYIYNIMSFRFVMLGQSGLVHDQLVSPNSTRIIKYWVGRV